MIQPLLGKLGRAFVLTLLVLALAGCGRFGPLEPAPVDTSSSSSSQAVVATNPQPASIDAAASSSGPAATPPQKPATTATVVPITKSFFLDPLVN